MKAYQKNIISILIFIIGAAFVISGFMRGELDVLLKKATTVCLECIGIG